MGSFELFRWPASPPGPPPAEAGVSKQENIQMHAHLNQFDPIELCELFYDEFTTEELFFVSAHLGYARESIGIYDSSVRVLDLKTILVWFLVGNMYQQGRLNDLLVACEKIQPGIIDDVYNDFFVEWQPNYPLTEEIISLVNGILPPVLGHPYVIDRSPSLEHNWESYNYQTSCYCWLFESLYRGMGDICESQPLWQLLSQVRKASRFVSTPAFAYIGAKRTWGERGMGYTDCIIVAPTNDQFDAIRIEETNDSNCVLGTLELIRRLRFLDEFVGIDIIGVYEGWVDIQLKQIPKGEELYFFKRLLHDRFSCREYYRKYLEMSEEELTQPFSVGCDVDD